MAIEYKSNTFVFAFDALILESIEKELGIDLADVSGVGWQKVLSHAPTTAKVAAFLAGDPKAASTFKGEQFTEIRAALESAAADFFPANDWSAIRSNLKTRQAIQDGQSAADALPMLEAFKSLSPEIQKQLIEAKGDTSLLELDGEPSASGRENTPLNVVGDLPESLEGATSTG